VKFQINRGFTLLELMIVVLVLIILASVALPSMVSTIQNNRMTAQANGFLTAFQLARTEALKRNDPVSVCPSSDGATCDGDWEDGWIVFVDGNAAGTTTTSVDEVLQIWDGMQGDTSNEGDAPDFVRYQLDGTVDSDAGTTFPVTFDLEIPDCTADNNRRLEIMPTGRASVTRLSCS